MIVPSYLKNLINRIYLYKITREEIHVLVILQLDWMLKGTLLCFKVYNVFFYNYIMLLLPSCVCLYLTIYAFKMNYKELYTCFILDNILH